MSRSVKTMVRRLNQLESDADELRSEIETALLEAWESGESVSGLARDVGWRRERVHYGITRARARLNGKGR